MFTPIGRHVMLLEHPRRTSAAHADRSTDVTAAPLAEQRAAGAPAAQEHAAPTPDLLRPHPEHHDHHVHVVSHATGKRHVLHDVLDIVGLLLVGLVAWVLWPASLGGSTHIIVVQGHSMEPVFHLGDAIVVKNNHDPKVGDIIVFRIPADEPGAGSLVVHRIVGFRADGTIITRGDNRTIEDPFHVRPSDIVGTPSWTLPHVGRMIGLASNPFVVGGAIGLLSLLMLLPDKDKDKDKDDDEDPDASQSGSTGASGAEPPPRVVDPARAERRRRAMAALVPRRGRRLARHAQPDDGGPMQQVVRPPLSRTDSAGTGVDDCDTTPRISPAVAARVRSLTEPATLELPVMAPDELDDLLSHLGPDA